MSEGKLTRIGLDEKRVIQSAIAVLTFSAGVLAYLFWGRGIDLPGCVTDVAPYSQSAVKQLSSNQVEVRYVARMWGYEPAELEVRPGTELSVYVHSVDVTHGFHLENTNVNLMVVPGAVNFAKVKLTVPGEYRIVCHEYCGGGHQAMAGVIRVREGAPDLTAPLAQDAAAAGGEAPAQNLSASAELSAHAQKIFTTKGCVGCHSTDGKAGVGPTFAKLFGKQEKFTDGSEMRVDEAYLREAILEPAKKIVAGFQPIMPKMPMTEDEVKTVIEFLKEQK